MLNYLEPFFVKYERVFVYLVLISLVNLTSGSRTNEQDLHRKKSHQHPLADHLLAKIKEDNWTEEEIPCFNDVKRLFEAARNHTLWAIWVLDSMQVPVGALYGSRYHLGNFDQCLDESWSSSYPDLQTQYCLVDVTAQEHERAREFNPYDDAEPFFKSSSKHGRRRYLNSIGVCVPASCSPRAVEKISFHIIRSSHLPYGDVSVDPRNCQLTRSKEMEYSFGYYVFWFIILTLIAAATTVSMFEDYITDPKLSEIAAWFSPRKNFESLMDTRAKEVKSLHGIRFISSAAMVVLHYIYEVNTLAIINHASASKDAETSLGRCLTHLEILINSFNVLTGFLFVRAHCHSNTLKPFEVIYKRYQRFIPLYAMIIFYIISVSPHTGSGPLWPRYLKREHEPCVRNWWSGLLMMFSNDNICYIPAWYISCDFQLSLLGLLILWCWKKDQRKGVMVFSAAMIFSIVLPAFQTYWHRLSPFLIYDLETSFDVTQNRVYHKVYSKTFSHASSYLIGFATGYLFYVMKPEQNRKLFSKTSSIISSLALGYMVIAMMNAIGTLLGKEYDSFIFAWYAGIDKVVWAVALCGLIVICEYGILPIVTKFLSGKLFIVCSRLSYGVYLIHMALLKRNLFSLRAPITYDFLHLMVNGMGYMIVSFLLSYLQWFIIEAPANNMFKYFQKNRSRNQRNIEDGKQIIILEKQK